MVIWIFYLYILSMEVLGTMLSYRSIPLKGEFHGDDDDDLPDEISGRVKDRRG